MCADFLKGVVFPSFQMGILDNSGEGGSAEADLQAVSGGGDNKVGSTVPVVPAVSKPVSILNNRINNTARSSSSVRNIEAETHTEDQDLKINGGKDEAKEIRPNMLHSLSYDSSGSIPKYASFDKYKNSTMNGNSNSDRKLKIVTSATCDSSPQKSSTSCSSASAPNTAVSFTVSNNAKIPHHRYSISSKPGRSSKTNSPNASTEHLNERAESPSVEKNSIVHMPGDFIYFEPKSRTATPTGSTVVNTSSSANANITPRKEVIMPFTGPHFPFTEFFQKQDDKKFHLLIGATGSVATIKVPLIIDKLFKIYTPEKVSIQLIVTKPAEHFLKGLKISTHVKIWREEDEWFGFRKLGDPVLHHELRKWADIFLIAPLSANTLAKLANGICNNLLTSVLRDWTPSTPVLVAPAMNTFMYINPMTKTHLKILQEDAPYITVLSPVEKVLICGDIGMGGMREWSEIVEILRRKITDIRKLNNDGNGEARGEDEDDNGEKRSIDGDEDEDEDEDDEDDDEDDEDDEDDDDEEDDDDDEEDEEGDEEQENHTTATGSQLK